MQTLIKRTLVLGIALGLTACGGGGSSSSGSDDNGNDPGEAPPGSNGAVTGPDVPDPVAPIAGDIARYGVVAVGDENGVASDAVAAFFQPSSAVAPESFGAALMAGESDCRVRSLGESTTMSQLETISVVSLPSPAGVDIASLDAGETVTLSTGEAGTWTELQSGPFGEFNFYDASASGGLPDGPVPADLLASVAGNEFPGFTDVALPAVEPLDDVSYEGGGNVTSTTRFTWEPSATPGARIRLLSQTAGAFFLEPGEGVAVSCLVPDSGEFVFPADAREALGEDFDGAPPSFSRVAIATERQDDALLILVRESFAP